MKNKYSFMATDRYPETGLWRFEFSVYADDKRQAYWKARKILERNFKHYGHANADLRLMEVNYKIGQKIKLGNVTCDVFDISGKNAEIVYIDRRSVLVYVKGICGGSGNAIAEAHKEVLQKGYSGQCAWVNINEIVSEDEEK